MTKNTATQSHSSGRERPPSGVPLHPAGRTHSTTPVLTKRSTRRTTHIASSRQRGREMIQASLLPLTHAANPKEQKNPSFEMFTTWSRPLLGVSKNSGRLSPHSLPERSSHRPGRGQHGCPNVLSLSPLNPSSFGCPWQPEFPENSKVTMRSCLCSLNPLKTFKIRRYSELGS